MKLRGYNNKARVKQRRDEAIERKIVRDKRTSKQQLDLIKTRRGESKKEKHRLVATIEKAYEDNNGINNK